MIQDVELTGKLKIKHSRFVLLDDWCDYFSQEINEKILFDQNSTPKEWW